MQYKLIAQVSSLVSAYSALTPFNLHSYAHILKHTLDHKDTKQGSEDHSENVSLSLWVSDTFFSWSALRGLGERQRLRESGAIVGG